MTSAAQNHEARSTNFVFSIGYDYELTFAVQTTNITDISLGETYFMTGVKDIKMPSNKVTNAPLMVDFILSEDLVEWIEIYKWVMQCKNFSNPMDATRPCSLILLNSQSQKIVTFDYSDVFPIEMAGIQYSIAEDGSNVLTLSTTFSYNRLKVTDKNGNIIDEQFTG